jgi:hypothetical protein
MAVMSCANPRTVLLAKWFTTFDYPFDVESSGSLIVEP